jgi:uncharacterized spore protein YtfJ
MQNSNFIEKVFSGFNSSATIKNVFGEPVQVGDKTIIPVAKLMYGFGGGSDEGHQMDDSQNADSKKSGGSGGGGGLHASAKGVYEITPTCTRFIPASPYKHMLVGVAIGLILKSFFKKH